MLEARHADEISRRFSLGEDASITGPISRGEQGQIWRLRASRGTFAVKESFETLSESDVQEEGEYQEAARSAGVPAPAVIQTAHRRVLADLGDAQVRVYEWVNLGVVDRGLDPVLVGQTVAAIHRVRFAGSRPIDPWYTDPVGPERWDELVGTLRERRAPFAERLAEYRDELVALEGLLEPPGDLQTCHRDLWADNVRSTADGGVCVIDWENNGLADPSQELALALFEFGATSPGRAQALSGAYVDAGGPGRVDRPGDFSMTIAQLGHIGEIACATWLNPDEPEEERRRAVVRFDEFADVALTRNAIMELLEAVR